LSRDPDRLNLSFHRNPSQLLSAHTLGCIRGERRLFAGIDFAVEPGECLHVRGENGVGKTSLLRILAGLAAPAEGAVTWRGQPVARVADDYHQNLLFLGHHNALKEDLTGLENLMFAAGLDGATLAEEEASAALRRFGLRGREDLPVRCLSAGQKRRVLLARLLTRKASLWILDEPFAALDTSAVQALADLIAEHLANGGMTVMTSHQAIPLNNVRSLQL